MDVISAGAGAADVVLQAVSVPAGCLLPGKEPVAFRLKSELPALTGTWSYGRAWLWKRGYPMGGQWVEPGVELSALEQTWW